KTIIILISEMILAQLSRFVKGVTQNFFTFFRAARPGADSTRYPPAPPRPPCRSGGPCPLSTASPPASHPPLRACAAPGPRASAAQPPRPPAPEPPSPRPASLSRLSPASAGPPRQPRSAARCPGPSASP